MGVPKFYRWISERYPCLSEVIKDSQIPEFDNMYLDMNGIIHNCSHPNDDDVTFRITEEQIFEDVFAYIEKLFLIIRPRKVFFMAIDGVAPRAKMNQQRARRFMSARTAQEQLDRAKKKGQDIPNEKRFDPNCITPGTYFMTELHNRLSLWVENKVNSDPTWQGLRIYISGHDCPGEGEHKIMDFIRAERSVDGYDPNTRHCMYGLDADLLMLGICSHEPHFSLLREEVKFNRPIRTVKGKKRGHIKRDNPSEITFHLLHLSLLREYLAWEFHPVKEKLSFPYDMERIIDDWVLMGFLIGNDFIPHLPHVHIHDDALPLLYQTYMEVLPTLDGYINEAGYLNLKRFEIFLKAFARNDQRCFLQSMEDADFMRSKTHRMHEDLVDEDNLVAFHDWNISDSSTSTGEPSTETSESDAAFVSSDEEEEVGQTAAVENTNVLAGAAEILHEINFDPIEDEFSEALSLAHFKEMDDKDFENDVQTCWTKTTSNLFRRHKRDYYKEKMKFTNITKTELREQAEGYVRAIQWNLHYYYHGCVSWNWFYPHHYAPYISDVVDFTNMGMKFELNSPFRPFEQLLAVLPAASAECLPPPLRELMCNSESPIADFYPTDFGTDLNGKKNDWEAVVLIPFIDEKRLLEAINSLSNKLSEEENCRNTHGGHLLFTWDVSKKSGERTTRSLLSMDKFCIAENRVIWGLLPNVKLDVYFPGFPTMRHLPHFGHLKEVNAKVFQQASKKPSMVLIVKEREEQKKDLLEIAFDLIGKEVCIDWPILKMGKVDSIWDLDKKYEQKNHDEVAMIEMNSNEMLLVRKLLQEQKEHQLTRYAIDISSLSSAIVFVRPFLGFTYIVDNGILKPQKQWGGAETVLPVLLPLIVTNVLVEQKKCLGEISVEQAYPKNSKVFVMEPSWEGFGFPAIVDAIQNSGKPNCRVVVVAAIGCEPNIRRLVEKYDQLSLSWMNGFEAGRITGINPRVLSRITGTLFLVDDKIEKENNSVSRLNIGLSLKLSKRNLEVADYTRRGHDGFWQYSSLCIQLLGEYRNRFRDLFTYLGRNDTENDVYYADEIWKNESSRKERIIMLSEWLCSLPTYDAEKQKVGTEYADIYMIGHLENAIKKIPSKMEFKKSSINPSRLYRVDLMDKNVRPEAEANFHLLDRVVYTLQDLVVPFGLQGTVVSILSDRVDVLFDKEFRGGITIRGNLASGARVLISSLINITFSRERKRNKTSMELGIKKLTSGKVPMLPPNIMGPSTSWMPKNEREGLVRSASKNLNRDDLLLEKPIGSFPFTILKRLDGDTCCGNQDNSSGKKEELGSVLGFLTASTNSLPKKNKEDKMSKQGEKPVTTEMTGKKCMNWKTKKTRVPSKQLPTMLPDSAHYAVKRPHTINDDKPMCCTVFDKDKCICSHKYFTSSQYSWRQRKIGEHQSERKDRNASNSGLQDRSSHRQDIYNLQHMSHILEQNLHSAPSREHSPIFPQMENIAVRNHMHKTQTKGHSFNNSQRHFVSSSFPKDLKLTDMKPSTVTVPRRKEKVRKQQKTVSTSNNHKSEFMESNTEQSREIEKDTQVSTINEGFAPRRKKRTPRLAAKFNNQ